jgi:Putative zinc-finger
MNCPAEHTLRAYQDGELERAERTEIEKHLANCSPCQNRLGEIGAAASRVEKHLASLDVPATDRSLDPHVAFARFKAEHDTGDERRSIFVHLAAPRWRPAWALTFAAVLLITFLAFPSGRSLAQRLLGTLRVERVQPVRVDFSALEGNRPLQQMLGRMLSDKVVVSVDEKPQHALTAADASQLAGFPVRLLGGRSDTPQLTVQGQHAFNMSIDRARLQDIFDQAGRSDLILPANLDGAMVSVQIPRSVSLEYGDCSRRNKTEEGTRREQLQTNCLVLEEAPSPVVSIPSDLNVQQLAEIGLELTGMSPTEARKFCQSIDWKTTLVLPIPRNADSYSVVDVNGAQGTLVSNSGRRGQDYVLIWVKNGIIYFLAGHGDSSAAVTLANSLD